MQALLGTVTAVTVGGEAFDHNHKHTRLQIDWPEGVSPEVLVAEGLDASAAVDLMHGRDPTAIPRMAYDHNWGLQLRQAGCSHAVATANHTGRVTKASSHAGSHKRTTAQVVDPRRLAWGALATVDNEVDLIVDADAAVCDAPPGRTKRAPVLADTDDDDDIQVLPQPMVTSIANAPNVHVPVAAPCDVVTAAVDASCTGQQGSATHNAGGNTRGSSSTRASGGQTSHNNAQGAGAGAAGFLYFLCSTWSCDCYGQVSA